MYGIPLSCDAEGCQRSSLFRFGSCVICWRHFCGDHLRDRQAHDCQKATRDTRVERQAGNRAKAYEDIIAKLDVPKLLLAAESLRPGCKAIAPPLPLLAPGTSALVPGTPTPGTILLGQGSNLHVPITFSDGVKWMIRIRQKGWDGPNWEVLKLGMGSEVVALNYMRDRGVAVPRAYLRVEGDGLCEDLVYSFQESIAGNPMRPRRDRAELGITMTDQDLIHIRSLARHFLDLEQITFKSFGSLHPTASVTPQSFDNITDDPNVVMGPFVRYFPTSPTSPYFSGPFRTAKEMYLTYIDHLLTQTSEGRRYDPAYEVEAYLILLEARELVSGCEEMEGGWGYIKHGDDKGDHFMVDDEGKLTGVIDWEWTYITSKGEAFAASYALTDKEFRKKGSNVLSPREKLLAKIYEDEFNRPDMAACVREGKKYQRLYELLRFEDRNWISAMALRRAFEGGQDEAGEDAPKTAEEWFSIIREKHADNEGLEAIERRANIKETSRMLANILRRPKTSVVSVGATSR